MNRYARDGIARDIANGKRVIALFGSMVEAREAMAEVALSLTTAHSVHKANGKERIAHSSGGVCHFRSRHQLDRRYLRGLTADVVYGDFELSRDQLNEILPSLNNRSVGELILAGR